MSNKTKFKTLDLPHGAEVSFKPESFQGTLTYKIKDRDTGVDSIYVKVFIDFLPKPACFEFDSLGEADDFIQDLTAYVEDRL